VDDGLPRWVATHIVLGTYGNGAFTDGESIAQAETRLGRTVGPVQLKFVLTQDYTGVGCQVEVTATRADTGASEVLRGKILPGMKSGDLVLLRPCPHHKHPSPSWFVDVTNIAQLGGKGMGSLSGQVVNDGPAWHSSVGVAVTAGAYIPWACDVLFLGWEPECRVDYLGRVHVVYNKDGALLHRTWQPGQSAWSAADCITRLAGWPDACERHAFEIVGPLLLVTCESAGERVWFLSTDQGQHWDYRSGNVAFNGMTNVQTTVDYMGRVWG